jgi:hypothetical protein
MSRMRHSIHVNVHFTLTLLLHDMHYTFTRAARSADMHEGSSCELANLLHHPRRMQCCRAALKRTHATATPNTNNAGFQFLHGRDLAGATV